MIAAAINRARDEVLALLTDTVTITREIGITVDQWGSEIPVEAAIYAAKPGLVQDTATNRQGVVVKAGEREHDALGYVLKVPVTVDVQPGDWVTVDASLDPRHVGRRWRVTAVPTQAWAIVHRCLLDPDEAP